MTQFLRCIDIDSTDKDRLSFSVTEVDLFNYGIQLLLLCLKYRIRLVYSLDRSVCWNDNNIHTVYLSELLFLCLRCTSHTCFLVKHIEKVLERDGCKSLTLSLYLHILLCLYSLMQSIGETTSRHDTSGKLVNYENFIILYNVIPVSEHEVVCTESQDNVVLYLHILRI